MSRLTNKNIKVIFGRMCRMQGKTLLIDIIRKLSNLEDIEDELGCPLEVVFKALKDTYIWISQDKTDYSVDFCLENYSGKWYISSYDKAELYLCKDYKKTWFLKGDLSE